MTGIYPAPILDKAGETQVNNISIVIRRDSGSLPISLWAPQLENVSVPSTLIDSLIISMVGAGEV